MFKMFTTALVIMALAVPAASRIRPAEVGGRPGVGEGRPGVGEGRPEGGRPGFGGGRPGVGGGRPEGGRPVAGGGRPNECKGYVDADACNEAEEMCVWCQKTNVTDGICKPDRSSNGGDDRMLKGYGGHHRGGCCGIAKTEAACFANTGTIGDDECVWFSTDTTVTTVAEIDIVDPRDRTFCSTLRCKMVANETQCVERGCEWEEDRCADVNCRTIALPTDCEIAGLGGNQTCAWKSYFGSSECVHVP